MNKYEESIKRGYRYDCITGEVFGPSGKSIKRKSKQYYVFTILIDNVNKYISHHRFGWFYHYGVIDDDLQIDHINQNKTDNRICNLRQVSHQENNFNKTNKGVYEVQRKDDIVYISKIKLNGKSIHLGTFDTEEEARQAYIEAKQKYHEIRQKKAPSE